MGRIRYVDILQIDLPRSDHMLMRQASYSNSLLLFWIQRPFHIKGMGPWIQMSIAYLWVVTHPAWTSVLRAIYNHCHLKCTKKNWTFKEHSSQEMKWVFFLLSAPLNRGAWMLLASKVWALRFPLGADISKCSKNFYYLKDPLKMSQSLFKTDSSVALNSIYTTDAMYTDLNFVQIVSWEGFLHDFIPIPGLYLYKKIKFLPTWKQYLSVCYISYTYGTLE